MDLLADETWVRWKEKVATGYYIAVIMGPPCRSFSRARGHRPGPPVLRGLEPPELYGLPNLGASDKLKVQLDNILAERCFELASIQHHLELGFAIENQDLHKDHPSVFRFDSALRVMDLPGVKFAGFDQCSFGALSTKPTGVLYYKLPVGCFDEQRCTHEAEYHWVDSDSGAYWAWAKHPPMYGRKVGGAWATEQLSEYPLLLNAKLAACVATLVQTHIDENRGTLVPVATAA
jgi:hypothetical protein